MTLRIEDYAIVGDTETVALVGNNGSIDWLCLPRFDSAACFAALLGDETNGRWRIAPAADARRVERRYRPGTLVLETEFETAEGAVRVVDCMPPREGRPDVIRVVQGLRGRVPMRLQLNPRFDYGRRIPLVSRVPGGVVALAGPEALCLRASVDLDVGDASISAEFTIAEGDQAWFRLVWFPSHEGVPEPADAAAEAARTEDWWRDWSGRCAYQGPHRETVLRSLITLKALTYAPTGGIVAAATTSLPEEIGGVRNWDYRFCWLRDGAFTVAALARLGYTEEAIALGAWLRRAVAGDPAQLQIMYGIGGEHRLTEFELPWLAGYEGSRPVRVGNAASDQFQLDVYGEVIAAVYHAAEAGVRPREDAARSPGVNLEAIVDAVERRWREPDEGIWEVRGERQHFTYSKFSAWYTVDRALKLAELTDRDDARRALAAAPGGDPRGHLPARLRRRPQHVRPVLRRQGARREPAAHPGQRLPPGRRPPRGRDGRRRAARARDRAVRLALLDGGGRGRPGRQRGGVPDLFVLARQRARQRGTHGGGASQPRRAARPAERRGPPERGVRSGGEAVAGQLPPGLLAHRTPVLHLGAARRVQGVQGALAVEVDEGLGIVDVGVK